MCVHFQCCQREISPARHCIFVFFFQTSSPQRPQLCLLTLLHRSSNLVCVSCKTVAKGCNVNVCLWLEAQRLQNDGLVKCVCVYVCSPASFLFLGFPRKFSETLGENVRVLPKSLSSQTAHTNTNTESKENTPISC